MSAEQLKITLETLKTAYGPALFSEALGLLAAKSEAAPPEASSSKPKRTLSEEQKAKMKAGREAAKAKKDAEKAAGGAEEAVPAEAEPAEAAPKKPNAWINFTQRVEALIRADETARGVEKEAKMKTVVVKQFASALKSQKAYELWDDAEIIAAASAFVPPAVSKQAVAKKAEPAAEAVAEAAPAVAEPAPKPKKAWSEEAKKAAAAKRAAKKAAAAEAAKPAEKAVEAAEEPEEATAVVIEGESYVVLKNGAAYRHDGLASGGELGTFAGIYKDGVIDLTAEEP